MLLPPFPGFTDAGLQFLRDLKAHNDREWFKPRKDTFEDEIRWPLMCLVSDVAARASAFGVTLQGDPKGNLFRIYRDTRFSKNKAPYKTHASCYLSPTGDKKAHGGVYIHIEPGASFLASGIWSPERELLRAIRTRLADRPDQADALVGDLEAAGLAFDRTDTLKRLPRGFESHADSDHAWLLKLKSWTVSRPVSDDTIQSPGFTDDVLAFARDVQPLARFSADVTGS
jgi:uncharacterized protein (TIGR02453 family)